MKLKDQYKLHPVRRLDQTNYQKLTADSHVVSDSVVHWNSEEMNWDLRGGCQESGHHPIVHQHLGTSAPEIHTGNTYKTIRQLGSISWGVNFFSIAFLIICQKDNRTK